MKRAGRSIALVVALLVPAYLFAQTQIQRNDIHNLTCSYLAGGAGIEGLEFLADNGSVITLQNGRLSRGYSLDLAPSSQLATAAHVGAFDWVFTYRNGSTLYRWQTGKLVDSLVVPDESAVLEIRLQDSMIYARTSSGILLCASLGRMRVDSVISPFIVYAFSPFVNGVHVLGIDTSATYTRTNKRFRRSDSASADFSSTPLTAMSTFDGSIQFVQTLRQPNTYLLMRFSSTGGAILVDSSDHPFALSRSEASVQAIGSEGIHSSDGLNGVYTPLALDELEVYEYLPIYCFTSDSTSVVIGGHSFIAEIGTSRGWKVHAYLPRIAGVGLSVLRDGNHVGGLRGGSPRSVVVPGSTPYEWTPLRIRGSCFTLQNSASRINFIGGGELMTTWLSATPNLSFSRAGVDSVMCSTSTLRPDVWTENIGDTLYGTSTSTRETAVLRSTDRGRTWNRYFLRQDSTSWVQFMHADGDSVWIASFARTEHGLDTSVYRNQSYLRFQKYVRGALHVDTSYTEYSTMTSQQVRGSDLYVLAISNLVSTGPARVFGRLNLSDLSFTTLFVDESRLFTDFTIVNNDAYFADLTGTIFAYQIEAMPSAPMVIGRDLGIGPIEQLSTLNDSTLLAVNMTAPPSLYAISLTGLATSVHNHAPYHNLSIAAIAKTFPNPSTSSFGIHVVVANGWPMSDISIRVTSTLGSVMFDRPLTTLTSTTANGSDIAINIPCASWPTGSYVVSIRSSRGQHSSIVVKI